MSHALPIYEVVENVDNGVNSSQLFITIDSTIDEDKGGEIRYYFEDTSKRKPMLPHPPLKSCAYKTVSHTMFMVLSIMILLSI